MIDSRAFVEYPASGWEAVAPAFIQGRQHSRIGLDVVTRWAGQLPAGGDVLDLGCGFGVPLTEGLMKQGLVVHGVDASPTLVAEFQRRFPGASVACEAVEASDFFAKRFDGIVAVGLMFLLPQDVQCLLVGKMAGALKPGGRLLFTAPWQVCTWRDLLTGRESLSLGRDKYVDLARNHGMVLDEECVDGGENHYFAFTRVQD